MPSAFTLIGIILGGLVLIAFCFLISRVVSALTHDLRDYPKHPETGTVDPYQIRLIHDGGDTK